MAWSGYSEQGTGSQERGPGQFSVDVPGVVQKAEGPQFVPLRASGDMQSSGRVSVGAEIEADDTLEQLAKVGQAWLAPKIKEAQDRKFVEGMTRAASGVALQEIINEQDSFSKLFGDAPAVEGARAYTVTARKSAWVADTLNKMPELAKLSPTDLPVALQESMKGQLTGDPSADLLLQQELIGAMPDLIRQHTKAHYLYTQGEAKNARRTAFRSGLEAYELGFTAEPGTRSVDQQDKAEQQVFELLTPPPGVNEDSHMDDVADVLSDHISAGNFFAARLLYDTGVIDKLGPDRIDKVRKAALTNAPKALKKVIPQLLPELTALATNPPTDRAAYTAAWEAINLKASGVSGVPLEYGKLLDEGDLLRGSAAAISADQRAKAQSLIGAKKKAAEEGKEAILGGLIDGAMKGDQREGSVALVDLAASHPGLALSEQDTKRALGAAFRRVGSPQEQAKLVSRFAGDKIPVAEEFLQHLWEARTAKDAKWETHGAQFERLIVTYQGMSEAAKRQYFNEAQRDRLDGWLSSVQAGTPPQTLFEAGDALSRADSRRVQEAPDKGSAEAAVMEALQDDLTTSWTSMDNPVGEDAVPANVGSQELTAARAVVQGLMGKQTGPASMEAKAKRAWAEARQTGLLDVAGGRVILNEDPEGARANPLSKAVGINHGTAGMALGRVVDRKLAALQVDPMERTVIRMRGKELRYLVIGQDSNGRDVSVTVTLDEIKAEAAPKPKPSRGSVHSNQ